MSIVMQLQDVAESTRLGPLSGEVRAGEILHLVGPNGAGKSTLLARMAGMTSGKGSIQFAGPWKHGPQQNSRCIAPIFHNSRRRRLQCRSGTT